MHSALKLKFNIKPKDSFTALEIIIVVVIISIFSTLALTNFQKTIKKSRGKLAVSNLRIIVGAQKLYRARYDSYTECSDLDVINEDLTLDIEGKYFDYEVKLEGNGFRAIAVNEDGEEYSIDSAGDISYP